MSRARLWTTNYNHFLSVYPGGNYNMWDDRVIDIWDDRFVFVLSALFGISMWIVIAKKRDAARAGRTPWLAYGLLIVFLTAVTLILAGRYLYYKRDLASNIDLASQYPTLGTVLAFVIGSAVGSFSARYVWSLFGARFGAKDPLIGVLALLLLIIVYSLPVYNREISSLLSHIGLSSLKTPIAELTFTERSQFQASVVSAATASGEERAVAIPRPSYPRPGLDGLKHAVFEDEGPKTEDYLIKDARYITFFDQTNDVGSGAAPSASAINPARAFLRPAKTLARCLIAYIDIFPDSQLLLVDIKPAIQFFFRMHANAVVALDQKQVFPDHPADYAADLRESVDNVRNAVNAAIGNSRSASGALGEQQTTGCSAELKLATTQDLVGFTYLQPYVTIALANLLVAHGSPDEAIDVMTQWLYLWRCARGKEDDRKQRPEGCSFGPLDDANRLPEWFGIRAEFDLNVLLFQQAGEANITYRDFLRDHAQHFSNYMAKVGISIREVLRHCEDQKASASAETRSAESGPDIRATMLRSLLGNEDTLLRSELHFLASSSWVEMENLHERGLALTRFRLECIFPEGGSQQEQDFWQATLADYKITSGLLALAIADRLATTATSADERARADEIKNDGKQQLRTGYRQLIVFRNKDRDTLSHLPWRKRVFTASRWEESCSLAERAIRQLNGP
jgi:hypothetical protein